MRRIAHWIVRFRVWALIACAILSAVSVFTITKVNINYDFAEYLSEDTITRRSLDLMEKEFGYNEQLRIMFRDADDTRFEQALIDLNGMENVLAATHDPETDVAQEDGSEYRLVNVMLDECDAVEMARLLREKFPEEDGCVVAGSAASTLDIQSSLSAQVVTAMLIAVAVVIIVLLATSHAWAEPIPILITLALAILINMGTNWVFGTISFVTFAVCAILQLALSMDYSIMLLHAYDELRDAGMDAKDAMEEALARSFMPVASSALTTVAGLLALMFMSFTIGFDIGIVLAKGIVLSMVTVFLAMPGLILCMPNLLRRTAHKPLPLGGRQIARITAKARWIIVIALVLVIGVSAFLQTKNTYSFSDDSTQDSSRKISRLFGESNVIAVLVPGGDSDEDYQKQRELIAEIEKIQYEGRPAVTGVNAMVTDGAMALEYMTPADVSEMADISEFLVKMFFKQHGLGESVRADHLLAMASELMPGNDRTADLNAQLETAKNAFQSEDYARMIVTFDMPYYSESTYGVIEELVGIVEEKYGKNVGVAGSSVSSYDISRAFSGDLTKVNLLTVLAILLIIAVSFRSVFVPVILVCVIQGAIYITMAISAVQKEPVFFMSYLICVAMQMGATIDYGILMASHYRHEREDKPPLQALEAAMGLALPTVCTSGLILVAAGFAVGKVCTVFYVSSIGMLLARGATISILLILLLLPSLLLLLDKAVMHGVKKKA